MSDNEPARLTLHTATVPEAAAGQRLDRTLAGLLPDLSRARLQALVRDGRVTDGSLADGGRTIIDPSERVKPGQILRVAVPPVVPAVPAAQAIALNVVYEDDALLVVDKPAGLVVHPAAGNPDRTLVNALLAHCGDSLSGIGGVARPGIVHRLDKDTSGLMVVAKTDAAHAGLAAQFAGHALARTYRAVTRGAPPLVSGTVEAAIGRHPRDRKRMAVLQRGGRHAVTHYRRLAIWGPGPLAALVECRLETGRTHQIRVHLAHLGCPVLGDPVYGTRRRGDGSGRLPRFDRQALHAAELRFRHPGSGAEMRFTSELPEDMNQLVKSFETIV